MDCHLALPLDLCNPFCDRMIWFRFQSKPFNITVIQVYAPTINAEEAEVKRFYEYLQDLLELPPTERCPFHYRGSKYKSRKSRVKVEVLVAQSCPTFWESMECYLPGASVRGLVQARILKWVAMRFSRESSLLRGWTCISCIAGTFFNIWAIREAH